MTRSKFRIAGFWFLLIVTSYITINFISVFLEVCLDVKILKPLTLTHGQSDFLIVQIWTLGLLSIVFVPIIYLNAVVVTIDNFGKTISFKNMFTNKVKVYQFIELDGYVDTSWRDGYQGNYSIIYFIKDDKRIEKISGYYYSNYKELKASLTPLTYMGEREFHFFKNLKILFKQEVAD
jgi:hypothetical protein